MEYFEGFTIEGELPSLNEIINEARGNKYVSAASKKKAMEKVVLFCKKLPKIPSKADFTFTYYCKDRRKDKDNIAAGAKKIIFDALVKSGVMTNDGWGEVGNWQEVFVVDKKNPRIEVQIYI